MVRRSALLFSILIISVLVLPPAYGEVPVASGIDIARLFASSRDAIVIVMNERDDTVENIRKENEQRKALRNSGRASDDIKRADPLVHFFFIREIDRVAVWSSGAGFFVREDGIVITSYHVVKNSKNLFVILSSGERLPAEIIGFDSRPDYDIAVLKVGAKRTFPTLRLASGNNLSVGLPLLLIGHPYSYAYTASAAAISKLKLDYYPRFIQVHSSVLPGNSGSPLLNSDGAVVGVIYAAMINSDTQGFATPHWMVREVLDRVLAGAKEK